MLREISPFPLRLKNFSQKYLKFIFFNIGVLSTCLLVILAYSMKRSDNLSDTTFLKYDFPLRLKNFSQKYLKSFFFNIGGITYWSPGHFAVFHEKIRQVFSYLERYRRFRRRPVNYSTFNTVRVRRDLRLKNLCQKYFKSIFFNIGGISYWSPGHFGIFHEKIGQVFKKSRINGYFMASINFF